MKQKQYRLSFIPPTILLPHENGWPAVCWIISSERKKKRIICRGQKKSRGTRLRLSFPVELYAV